MPGSHPSRTPIPIRRRWGSRSFRAVAPARPEPFYSRSGPPPPDLEQQHRRNPPVLRRLHHLESHIKTMGGSAVARPASALWLQASTPARGPVGGCSLTPGGSPGRCCARAARRRSSQAGRRGGRPCRTSRRRGARGGAGRRRRRR
jgi:hypothetical protein